MILTINNILGRKTKLVLWIFSLWAINVSLAFSQAFDGEAQLIGDTLIISNSKVTGKWFWNHGDPKLCTLSNSDNQILKFKQTVEPSLSLEGHPFVRHKEMTIDTIRNSILSPAYISVTLTNEHEGLQVMRQIKLYPGSAAFSETLFLKYESLLVSESSDKGNSTGIEIKEKHDNYEQSYLANYQFLHPHWSWKAVRFRDRTDIFDNLVSIEQSLFYKQQNLQGNLLIGENLADKQGFFILKEAPNENSQLHYPGHDYVLSNNSTAVSFSGFPDLGDNSKWYKGYTHTIGFSGDKENILMSLREYLKQSTLYGKSHEMIMMNTWGDRGRDGKISEAFLLEELEKAHKLGITHFQIDDGWQQGRSSNSIDPTGGKWNLWKAQDWQFHSERFPEGPKRVLKSARDKGIQLGLWFHPSNEQQYANWELDAEVIINIYHKTGIKYFKIDGIEIPDKMAATNLKQFFTKVKKETKGAVFFNLDLTAGIRGGYFMYRNLGNLFLENRYTDWGNYYPYRTLRNLWMLSKYLPTQWLQIEFLNNSRNSDKYPEEDPFMPSEYAMDYLFAITMAAQPLAWMEATGLTEKQLGASSTIKAYKEIQSDLHSGNIFPLGEEPSGRSWTGFQSILKGKGYFLIYREDNDLEKQTLRTYLPEGTTIKIRQLVGTDVFEAYRVVVDKKGQLTFWLPKRNSFQLLAYDIEESP